MNLTQSCKQAILQFPQSKTIWIALSGGIDSTALIHVLASLRSDFPQHLFKAIHIHHGLSANADAWQLFCKNICEKLALEFVTVNVNAKAKPKQSPEESARIARHQAIENLMQDNDLLFTAHHQNDQAETFLLMLFRGSGLAGLSAMPFAKPLGLGYLVRPWLSVSREIILDYLAKNQLDYIVDESNQNNNFDRNFIRNEILPLIQSRYCSIIPTLAKTSNIMANEKIIADESIELDLKNCVIENKLNIETLKLLSHSRMIGVLRHWLLQHKILTPSFDQSEKILKEVIFAKIDANPLFILKPYAIRRFKNFLYVTNIHFPDTQNFYCSVESLQEKLIINLPQGLGDLIFEKINFDKIELLKSGEYVVLNPKEPIKITFRKNGEVFKLNKKSSTHSLKHLMLEWQIPPWQRDQIPLIFQEDKLLAVVGYASVELDGEGDVYRICSARV